MKYTQLQSRTSLTHIGYAAIENANTFENRGSKIVTNSVFDCHLSPQWRKIAIEKHCFSSFSIRVHRLVKAFSIAAYPVC